MKTIMIVVAIFAAVMESWANCATIGSNPSATVPYTMQ